MNRFFNCASLNFRFASNGAELLRIVARVAVYSDLATAAMLLVGRRFADVVQDEVQAEAEFRAAANRVRETGEGILKSVQEAGELFLLRKKLLKVIEQWRRVCWQHVRTTVISHANALLAPAVGLIFCTPKYASGAMPLGEVTQVAAAFVTLQGSVNWLVNNFQRLADWRSSAIRVAMSLEALDLADGPIVQTPPQRAKRSHAAKRASALVKTRHFLEL
jgi:ABC-type uncharacterized transport system fused permease/ATPase subunit